MIYRYGLYLLFSKTKDKEIVQCRICSLRVTRRTARVHAIRRHPGALENLAKDGKLSVALKPSYAKLGRKQLLSVTPAGGTYSEEAAQ